MLEGALGVEALCGRARGVAVEVEAVEVGRAEEDEASGAAATVRAVWAARRGTEGVIEWLCARSQLVAGRGRAARRARVVIA